MRENQLTRRVRRVLQVGGLAGPEGAAGGVWAVASTQTEALRRRGLEVILLGTWLGVVPRNMSDANNILTRVRRPFPGAGLRALYSFSFLRRVSKEARNVEVAHIHLCRDFTTVLSTIIIARRGVPIVVQTHGMFTEPKNRLIRFYDFAVTRRLIRLPTLWLALTAMEERNLKSLGVLEGRIERIVNASTEAKLNWSDPQDSKFLFIARLAARKQPRVFVEAAIKLLDEGIEASFVLAGPDQGEEGRLRSIIEGSGYSNRFEILGHIDPSEARRLMASVTAFVLPARNEPYPMAIIEAASVGTPIILTRECGLAPAIEAASAGIIVEPDTISTYEAMRKIIESSDLRTELSENATSLHRSIWSVESLADSLMEKYERSGHES